MRRFIKSALVVLVLLAASWTVYFSLEFWQSDLSCDFRHGLLGLPGHYGGCDGSASPSGGIVDLVFVGVFIFPAWVPPLALALYLRLVTGRRPGTCQRCGYTVLRSQARCPECGHPQGPSITRRT